MGSKAYEDYRTVDRFNGTSDYELPETLYKGSTYKSTYNADNKINNILNSGHSQNNRYQLPRIPSNHHDNRDYHGNSIQGGSVFPGYEFPEKPGSERVYETIDTKYNREYLTRNH